MSLGALPLPKVSPSVEETPTQYPRTAALYACTFGPRFLASQIQIMDRYGYLFRFYFSRISPTPSGGARKISLPGHYNL